MPAMPTGKGTPLQLSGSVGGGVGGGSSSSSGGVTPTGTAVSHPHPYRHPILSGNYEDDFPLRKTGTSWPLPASPPPGRFCSAHHSSPFHSLNYKRSFKTNSNEMMSMLTSNPGKSSSSNLPLNKPIPPLSIRQFQSSNPIGSKSTSLNIIHIQISTNQKTNGMFVCMSSFTSFLLCVFVACRHCWIGSGSDDSHIQIQSNQIILKKNKKKNPK